MPEPVKLLTIAGSDSGGAAGLQADLKTWTALGVYGMSAVTVVTAQNSVQVAGVQFLPAGFVAQQIDTVLSDYGAAGVKTGFLGQVALIEAVAERLAAYALPHVVVDPVLVNHRGEPLFAADVAAAYRALLLPLATLATPNWREAALLAGRPRPGSLPEVVAVAQALPPPVLVTGWAAGEEMVDVFCPGRETHLLHAPRHATTNTHGSGDTLSAAITAYLALGQPLFQAIHSARSYTGRAIARASGWHLGAGHGPLDHLWHHA